MTLMELTAGIIGWAADGRWRPASVVIAVNSNWMWRIVQWTALGSVTVWRTAQQIDTPVFISRITHSTHCTNFELSIYPRFTALSIFIQQCLTWKCCRIAPNFEHYSGHVTFSHMVANRWNQVNTAGNWVGGSRLQQCSCGAQPMRTHIQTVTGTNAYANT